MREILFKAKRLDNGEWVEGLLFKYYGEFCIALYSLEGDDFGLYPTCYAEVDPDTIGQYTGLTDKNGKEIFEGDIVDASTQWWNASGPAGHDSPTLLVEWSDDHCGFDPFANYDCDCGVYINAIGCEVIGNKWDNPELLESKESKE